MKITAEHDASNQLQGLYKFEIRKKNIRLLTSHIEQHFFIFELFFFIKYSRTKYIEYLLPQIIIDLIIPISVDIENEFILTSMII